MKIKLVDDVHHALVMSTSGKTMAEKETRYEMGSGPHVFNYERSLRQYQGKWMEVDTKYLFEMSFNGIMEGGGIIDVQAAWLVQAVDISPEFNNLEEWIAAVQKRYDKDWPGRKVSDAMTILFKDKIVNHE